MSSYFYFFVQLCFSYYGKIHDKSLWYINIAFLSIYLSNLMHFRVRNYWESTLGDICATGIHWNKFCIFLFLCFHYIHFIWITLLFLNAIWLKVRFFCCFYFLFFITNSYNTNWNYNSLYFLYAIPCTEPISKLTIYTPKQFLW